MCSPATSPPKHAAPGPAELTLLLGFKHLVGEADKAAVRTCRVRPPRMPRWTRLLPLLATSVLLATACSSSGSNAAGSSKSPVATPLETPAATSSPVLKGDTPDERFQSWLDTGGREEAYQLWSTGQLGEGPPSGMSEEQKRRLFETWLEANLDRIRSGWDRASILQAESDLHNSMAVALVFSTEHEGFEGFSPKEGRKIERSVRFTTSRASFGVVSIRQADRTSIVFTTESASGAILCMAWTLSEDHASFGLVDARTAAECQGGGWIEPNGGS